MTVYETHPLAELIPAMSEEEYGELREDVATNGLREPITLYEGRVLDGRHRLRACDETGAEIRTREYDGDEPVVFVISMNVHRRHLSTAQRAEVVRRALPHLHEQARERQGARTDLELPGHMSRKSPDDGRAREQAGKLVGVSGRTVAELDRVAREAPELHAQVLTGEKGVREAWRETRERAAEPETKAKPPSERALEQQRKLVRGIAERARHIEDLVPHVDLSVIRQIPGEETEEWKRQLSATRTVLSRLIAAL